MRPLQRLRLRLTLWYAGAFALTLLLLGGGLFVLINRLIANELDHSLATLVTEVVRAARIRIAEGYEVTAALSLARAELDTPDRGLYLFDARAEPLEPAGTVDPRIAEAVTAALADGQARAHFVTPADQNWRLYAARWEAEPGQVFAVVALMDIAGLERQSAKLVELFLLAGLLAIGLLSAGGYWLARVSTRPVEESVERMRRFTADAAHELRTPVAVIRGRAEVARERERSAAEYADVLEEIDEEAERLGRIVDDLLTLARADTGERPIERQRVFLDDIAGDAVSAAGVLARRGGVRLEIGRYEEAPVLGDPALLRQLVMILLDNAIKFTPEGRAVRLDVFTDGGAALVVEDEGIGIAPADLPRVFDRFYRADAARARPGGAGLGLSIGRWIADVHQAHLEAASEPERGTRVTVHFPPVE